ncbi:MAG: Tol-Pal system protein TolB, partial [Proteobacteria bacterium]|nr:Tol-Pal system protein TolB [Pseudomonadota bacterium]
MMPKPKSRNFFVQQARPVVLLLLGLFSFSASWANLDTIIIDQGVDDPIRIAVVPFEVSEDLADKDNPAKLIRFDLARSGQFDPVASENMLSYPSTENAVFFRDWRILQTAYLVIGQAQSNALGEIDVTYQLFDVATQTALQRENFRVTPDQWRDVGHKIADLVYTEVTGVRGAFSTKILYVLAQDVGTQRATYSLQMADVDGERARTLYRSEDPILSASWSPDGKRVAYVSFETGRPSIILQDVNAPNREQLTNFRGINGSPVFSPDGRQLAMVLSRSGDPEVFVMNLENRKLRRITRHPAI